MDDATWIPETALLAAKRGLAWLEQAMPEAVERLDVERLAMHDWELCVLGQACGDFALMQNWLEASGLLYREQSRWLWEHGFIHGVDRLYADLDRAWRRVLADRGAHDNAK